MKIKDIKGRIRIKETPGPPEQNEVQFGDVEHLCESCGVHWGILSYYDNIWICNSCRKHLTQKSGQKEFPI